ncbi:hypothetical protein M8C21_021312 [Ambrosia artemisiifolia]|uniref:Uncharacterized protein n=1 Tax=Ambrosia artemisiifolia TaxID=4212 RepID=A0AAD5GTE3_AMBAR|nr:hypothetical protein M8C21_021312 [Ambrosia artemisiifolia]
MTVVFSRFDGAVDSGLLRRRSRCFRFLTAHMLSDHRPMMVVGIYFALRHWMQEYDLILRVVDLKNMLSGQDSSESYFLNMIMKNEIPAAKRGVIY